MGAAADDFLDVLLDLVQRHIPCILILVETKTSINKALQILHRTSYNSMAISEGRKRPIGFFGILII